MGMVDPLAKSVLSFYFPEPSLVRQIEPLGNAGGWSGSQLWRVMTGAAGPFCLRRYPEGDWGPRLHFVHAVLDRVVAGGLTVIAAPLPSVSGTTAIRHADAWWELTPWMPGVADFHARPSSERLRSAMRTLARFHLLANTAAAPRAPHNLAPAMIDRQSTFRAIDEQAKTIASHLRPGLGEAFDARADHLLKLLCHVAPQLAPQVLAAANAKWLIQPAIRDIWHDHVLFTGDAVTGIVDLGAMRLDTPLTDIARLVGSLVGDDGDARRFALDAYAEVRPLSDEDRGRIDLLDASGQVVAAANWLRWLYVERRDMGPSEPIVRRLDEITLRLDGALAAIPSGPLAAPS
jgi:homoserine kinase type II